MIELILKLPMEGQVIILGSLIAAVYIYVWKPDVPRQKNPETINPFALSTRLNGETIKHLQKVDKNDRQRTNTTSNK